MEKPNLTGLSAYERLAVLGCFSSEELRKELKRRRCIETQMSSVGRAYKSKYLQGQGEVIAFNISGPKKNWKVTIRPMVSDSTLNLPETVDCSLHVSFGKKNSPRVGDIVLYRTCVENSSGEYSKVYKIVERAV